MLKLIKIFLAITHNMIIRFGKWMSKLYSYIGNLQEDVYVTQYESFESKEFFNKVCNL
jgi:hypothetical protein